MKINRILSNVVTCLWIMSVNCAFAAFPSGCIDNGDGTCMGEDGEYGRSYYDINGKKLYEKDGEDYYLWEYDNQDRPSILTYISYNDGKVSRIDRDILKYSDSGDVIKYTTREYYDSNNKKKTEEFITENNVELIGFDGKPVYKDGITTYNKSIYYDNGEFDYSYEIKESKWQCIAQNCSGWKNIGEKENSDDSYVFSSFSIDINNPYNIAIVTYDDGKVVCVDNYQNSIKISQDNYDDGILVNTYAYDSQKGNYYLERVYNKDGSYEHYNQDGTKIGTYNANGSIKENKRIYTVGEATDALGTSGKNTFSIKYR